MYEIKKTTTGPLAKYDLRFSGFIQADEMKRWVAETKTALVGAPPKFVVNVDMRGMKPLPPDAQEFMEGGQKLYKQKGMLRSAVLVDSVVLKMQFERLAKQSGIYEWERYFAASDPSYEVAIKQWLDGA